MSSGGMLKEVKKQYACAKIKRISEDFFSEIAQEIFKISSSRHLNEVYYC